jgi:hypothetical protein
MSGFLSKARTEPYYSYGKGVPQGKICSGASSFCGAVGSADRQTETAGRL